MPEENPDQKWPVTMKDWIESVQGVFTCLGIVAALWLWHAQGEGRPHLNLLQEAEVVALDEKQNLVAVDVTLKNVGKIAVSFDKSHMNVLGLLPMEIQGPNSNLPERLWQGVALDDPETGRVEWEALIEPITLTAVYLEPDEEQVLHLEFCIPSKVAVLRTDVNIFNQYKGEMIGWQHRKIIHTKKQGGKDESAP